LGTDVLHEEEAIMTNRTDRTNLKLGCAKVDITPPMPLPLAGFAHRQGDFETIVRPLNARIMFFQHGASAKALIVSADLLWWGAERVAVLKSKLRDRWGFGEGQIVFHATHNHSGPQTSGGFTPSLGKLVGEYIDHLEKRVWEGVEQAAKALDPVTIERGIGRCDLAVNRRKMVDGQIRMAPNPDGPVDPDVTVLRFAASDGKIKAVLVHYACHPTASGENAVSSDFPGTAMDLIEERLGRGAVSVFLQGCCADVRPALVRDGNFYWGGNDDVLRIGQTLANEVSAVLERPMERLSSGTLVAKTLKVQLPLQEPPTEKELMKWCGMDTCGPAGEPEGEKAGGKNGEEVPENEPEEGTISANKTKTLKVVPNADILEQWSRLVLSERRYLRRSVELELHYLEMAEGFALLTANAEMAGEYGRFIKSLYGGSVLPVCYTNGMIGYIPTAAQLAEGGYEAVDYIYYFGLPAPLAPESEESIRRGIRKLAGREDK
jgi:hypothetical protein